MARPYRTVQDVGESSFEVRGSRFLGRVEPVSDVPTAETMIATVREEHPDATHVVPAYRIRDQPLQEWASDDGEPRGSAGPPAHKVLTGRELVNVLATVVRYYGGTNLGIGGLARSYGRAVNLALDDTAIVERYPQERFSVEVSYDDSGSVRSVLDGSQATFEARYEERVTFHVAVPIPEASEVRERLLDATSGRARIEPT